MCARAVVDQFDASLETVAKLAAEEASKATEDDGSDDETE